MGDLAVEIVERAFSLMKQPPFPELIDFTEMANLVEAMALRCMEAFAKRDAEIAWGGHFRRWSGRMPEEIKDQLVAASWSVIRRPSRARWII